MTTQESHDTTEQDDYSKIVDVTKDRQHLGKKPFDILRLWPRPALDPDTSEPPRDIGL